MGLFILTVGAIIIGVSISKANARRRARQAYAARVAAWQEAQAEKARIAAERERAKANAEAARARREIERDAERRERLEAWREAQKRRAEMEAMRIEKMRRELNAKNAMPASPDAEKWDRVAVNIRDGMKYKPEYLNAHRAEILAAMGRIEKAG